MSQKTWKIMFNWWYFE